MKKRKKLSTTLWSVLILTFVFLTFIYPNPIYANNIEGYEKVANSSKLEFYYNDKDSSFYIENKITGDIWSSFVREEQYDINKLNKKMKGDLKSIFLLDYTDKVSLNGAVLTLSIESGQPTIQTEKIQNGVRVQYDFSIIKPLAINALASTAPNVTSHIKFDLEMTLDEDAFLIKVLGDSIVEEGNEAVVAIQMLPALGATADGQNGYIFYPEGSGALLNFSDMNHFNENKKTWPVYGSEISNYMAKLDGRQNAEFEEVMLPVYGVKVENNAFLAIIEEGKETSNISITPSGGIVGLNRISSEFVYRRFFDDPRVKTKQIKRFDKDLIQQDHSIRFVILENETANYSSMANTYRKYLLDNQLINKVIQQGDKIPMGIDFFMGINEKGLLFNKYIPMTTYEEVKEILELFKNRGVTTIQSELIGWTKKGYATEPTHFPPNNKLGGNSKFKALMQYVEDSGIDLYLQTNITNANEANGGFSKRKDVVYLGNDTILSGRLIKTFVLSPNYILKYIKNEFIKRALKYEVPAISYDAIGQIAYYDYNKNNFSTKANTVDVWSEILETTKQNLGKVATVGGNQYVLKYSDRLSSISESSKGYFFTTESIPFFQMVVHGLIPYSGNAGNLSHDFNAQKLKWIELGYMPYFELTHDSAEKLNFTTYNKLFTSKYDDWIDTAVEVYNELNNNISPIWSEYMVNHEQVKQKVYKVTYSNGTIIYVNYTDYNQKIEGYEIKASDYLVVK